MCATRHCESIGCCPAGWIDRLWHTIDFESSIAELSGHSHWYTHTLRGYVNLYRHRCMDAIECFEHAEKEYTAIKATAPEFRQMIFNTRAFHASARILHEAMIDHDAGARESTDDSMSDLVLTEEYGMRALVEMKANFIAHWFLLRGDPTRAMEWFTWLIDRSSTVIPSDQEFPYYFGAAVSAHRMGNSLLTDRHIESAAMAVSSVSTPFRVGIYAARMAGFTMALGRPDDASSWIDAVVRSVRRRDVQALFLDRANIMARAFQRDGKEAIII